MKRLIFILVVTSLCCIIQSSKVSSKLTIPRAYDHSNLALAVNKIAQTVFTNHAEIVNFVSAKNENLILQDLKDELLSINFKNDNKFVIRQEDGLITFKKRRNRCSVLLVQSIPEFMSIYERLSSNTFTCQGHYLVVLLNESIVEVEQIFKQFWRKGISNVNVIFEIKFDRKVLIQSFFPFNKWNCNSTTPVLINQFHEGKFEIEMNDFFLSKLNNLHQCEIRVSIANASEPFIFIESSSNGSQTFRGEAIDLINTLAESLNFKINYTYIGIEGFVHENGSSSGAFEALIDERADVSIQNWWLKSSRVKYLDSSTPYMSEPFVFLVPPGRELTPVEQLTIPFSLVLWMMILMCFLIGFVVICAVKFNHNEEFVFGARVENPCLNMFIGFIGGTQRSLPGRNFARFLLVCFLMYSLVIRTLYQGSFYQMLQSNDRKGEVQTIDEMIQNDFSFYALMLNLDVIQGIQSIAKRFSRINHFTFLFFQ